MVRKRNTGSCKCSATRALRALSVKVFTTGAWRSKELSEAGKEARLSAPCACLVDSCQLLWKAIILTKQCRFTKWRLRHRLCPRAKRDLQPAEHAMSQPGAWQTQAEKCGQSPESLTSLRV